MKCSLRIYADGKPHSELPIATHGGIVITEDDDDREFVFDQPAGTVELNVTEARLYAEQLPTIRFILPSFTVPAGEAGRWTVTARKNNICANTECELEYYATEQFGEVVRHPTVIQWDHEKEEMNAN